jgi:outer membrane protein
MNSLLKSAVFAGVFVATGVQAADLSGRMDMGGYKDDLMYSWWNAGDIFVRLRGEAVIPQVSSTGSSLSVSKTGIPEIDISYFITKNIAVEAICCVSPHEIDAAGVGKIGNTWLFPPSLLLQYHFDMSQLKPYVGAGVNYTAFLDSSPATGLSNLKLGSAWGEVLQAGLDYHLSGNWFANLDFKKLWLRTDYSVNDGATAIHGHVDLDPIIAGGGIGYRFGGGYDPLK